MPRKNTFSFEDIIEAAFQVVRKEGMAMLSARSIAKELNSSTMPIYSYLKSMKNLEEKIIQKAMALLYSYQTRARTGDSYIDIGLGYILFAKEEKHLFRCINDEKYMGLQMKYGAPNFEAMLPFLGDYASGLSDQNKRTLLFFGWIFSHGLADLISNAFHQHIPEFNTADENSIGLILKTVNDTFIKGFLG
ncbi:MAG: hypothetical protein C0403_04540 [Desulfobacterium sp.]|nr:hypothetical protein [Desulfobacterium sp.]